MNKIITIIIALLLIPIVVNSQGVERADYSLDKSEIVKTLSIDQFAKDQIVITNKKNNPITVTVTPVGDTEKLINLEAKTFKVNPSEKYNISYTLLGRNQGKYNGQLIFSGDISEAISANITVIEGQVAQLGNVISTISIFSKKITKGDNLRYVVTVSTLVLQDNTTINLNEILVNLDKNENETLNSNSIVLNTSISLTRTVETKKLQPGDYLILIEAENSGKKSVASIRFVINEPITEKKIAFVPLKFLVIGLILSSAATAGVMMYRKNKAKQKRYANKLDFNLLPKPGGPRTVFIGKFSDTERKAYYEIDQLASHTIIAGSTGGGKTVSAEVLIEEALMKGVSVITFDPTAQWTGFLRKSTEKRMLALYPAFGMKPTDARAFNGNVKQIMNAKEEIDIKKYIRPGEITCFSINRLEPEEIDVLVANTISQVFKANLPESKELKLMIIFDEVHRLLPKFGGSGQGFLMIERAVREFRKYGVGLMLISQVLTDFIGQTKANISNEIQMRTRDQGDLDRIKTKYGEYVLQSLLKAATGNGMMENVNYNRGDPFFVAFRPLLHEHARLSDEELDNYNKYNAIIDDLEYEIVQLQEQGIDVFDMQLELKMALDKVKSGNFNMVNIYLESLTPRLKTTWEKLGKTPKKREIKLIDDTTLKKAYEQAQADREKTQAASGEAPKDEPKQIKMLRLKSGIVVQSLQELDDALPTVDALTMNFHLNDTKNDFADWAKQIDEKLAAEFAKAKTKEGLIAAIKQWNTQANAPKKK